MNRVAATTIPLLVLILSLGRVPLLPEGAAAAVIRGRRRSRRGR